MSMYMWIPIICAPIIAGVGVGNFILNYHRHRRDRRTDTNSIMLDPGATPHGDIGSEQETGSDNEEGQAGHARSSNPEPATVD